MTVWREVSSSARAARTATVLPAPTSPVIDPDGGLVDTPGDAGDGLGVAGVAVQHGGGQVLGERGAGEAPVGTEPFDAHLVVLLVVVGVVGGVGVDVSQVRAGRVGRRWPAGRCRALMPA